MFLWRFDEKKLKMIWEVTKDHKRSYLVGTAHFFPYSFKTSFHRCLTNARTVLFEGPLDQNGRAKVVNCGFDPSSGYHIFDDLDRNTIDKITRKIAPKCRGRNTFFVLNLRKFCVENPLYEMVKGMKPWLAFFTIWANYLKKSGWKYSVDLEGYTLAQKLGKNIVYLESIEEQISVLENLSRDRIIEFMKRVDQWHDLSQAYVRCYLAGDLQQLRSKGLRFPSRHPSVINHRDAIFFERMRDYLERGDAVACIGAPHVPGVSKLLRDDGYQVKGPKIP
ncbi:MAG: TraB/GumN family protein [Deltaproteobacteria bacterium]|nr:TraB/GumN family protein [Deltaproteobacteria bacterium]